MLSMVICYNKKKWPGDDHPKSWADFWNVEKFPGRRAIRRTPPMWTIDAALLADGVKEDGFYPLDVDRAFKSLDRIKPHVKTWWSDNAQAQQLMEQEEVDLITMMNGRASNPSRTACPTRSSGTAASPADHARAGRCRWAPPTRSAE
jgi:putative spermidine/putrescine transport system substrate-binding protein